VILANYLNSISTSLWRRVWAFRVNGALKLLVSAKPESTIYFLNSFVEIED